MSQWFSRGYFNVYKWNLTTREPLKTSLEHCVAWKRTLLKWHEIQHYTERCIHCHALPNVQVPSSFSSQFYLNWKNNTIVILDRCHYWGNPWLLYPNSSKTGVIHAHVHVVSWKVCWRHCIVKWSTVSDMDIWGCEGYSDSDHGINITWIKPHLRVWRSFFQKRHDQGNIILHVILLIQKSERAMK